MVDADLAKLSLNAHAHSKPPENTPKSAVYQQEIYIKSHVAKIDKSKLALEFEAKGTIEAKVFYPKNHDTVAAVIRTEHLAKSGDEIVYIKLAPEVDAIQENLEDDGQEDGIPSAFHYILPSKKFVGLWESLLYDDLGLKPRLFNFMRTIQRFSQHQVDCNIVSLNKLILLHGPPGSGKTSLCQALAQKLTVQLVSAKNSPYLYGQLIEINCHSLFSKWFSESGKLVMKQFSKIREVAEDQECLVFVLIDEIESVASQRSKIDSGTEPTDSVRVVNAILTQLDSLKRYSNILVLSTSNLVQKIDTALLDRADLKEYIPLPGVKVLQKILVSAILELVDKKILLSDTAYSSEDLEIMLLGAARRAQLCNISGRSVKKLPFLACLAEEEALCVEKFILKLDEAVEKYARSSVLQ